MLGPRRGVPLPHAMTDAIEVDGSNFTVAESSVALELQNSQGDTWTVRRAVTGGRYDRNLIRTERGPALTQSGISFLTEDYFVRRPYAAQRPAGFHRALAEFAGWELPTVTRYDGSEGPLYIECLFPYFFVEQKHGWSGIQARIPTYYRIRDVAKRSAEFILSLEAGDEELERQRLESAKRLIEQNWKETVQSIQATAEANGFVVTGLPDRPRAENSVPTSAEVLTNDPKLGWSSLDQQILRTREELDEEETQVPRAVGSAEEEIQAELESLEEDINSLNGRIANENAVLDELRNRTSSVEVRINSLLEDLQRHKDAETLLRLGSDNALGDLSVDRCPTCSQRLVDGFDVTGQPMTLEENMRFIEEELEALRSMKSDLEQQEETREAALRSLRNQASDERRQVRAHKDALVAPNAAPSVAAVTSRVLTQHRLARLRQLRDELDSKLEELGALTQSWQRNQHDLQALGSTGPTELDRQKVGTLQSHLREQLAQYDFRSISQREIEISSDTFRPVHEGFDLGFDLSASDMIRVIWAYLLSLLEVGREYDTNHPQMLIFDEPRQQETERFSFTELLKRASAAGGQGSQIIFATSEEEAQLEDMLAGVRHSRYFAPQGSKLLQPV